MGGSGPRSLEIPGTSKLDYNHGMSNPKRALVILAPGAEEMEVTITVDVLRRAAIEVVLAGLDGTATVTCSRGLRITPDAALADVSNDYDVVILPGGAPGAQRLASSELVGRVLGEQWSAGRMVAAICAGPTALAAHDIAKGSTITSHPSVRDRLKDDYEMSDEPVVESGQLVTSQGPGTSFAFALKLVERLCGAEQANRVRAPMMLVG